MIRLLHHGGSVELLELPRFRQSEAGPMGALSRKLRFQWHRAPVATADRAEARLGSSDEAPASPEVVLIRALELFGPDGEHWVQHKRRDRGRFCAIAAIEEAALGDPFLRRQAEEQLRATVGRSPMLWNDSPGQPFSQIRAGFTAAIENERAGRAQLANVF